MTRTVIQATSAIHPAPFIRTASAVLVALSLGLAACGQHEDGAPSTSNAGAGAQTSSSSDTGNSSAANSDTTSSSNTQTLASANAPMASSDAASGTPSLADAALTAKVKSAIAADQSASKLQLQLQSIGGTVTVSGTAGSQAEVDGLTSLIQTVPSVKLVQNKVTVQAKPA
jgi:hypothetical protein